MFVKYYDDTYMKPWFIYDYIKRKHEIKAAKRLAK